MFNQTSQAPPWDFEPDTVKFFFAPTKVWPVDSDVIIEVSVENLAAVRRLDRRLAHWEVVMIASKPVRPRETLIRAPRAHVTEKLVVESKTIGTKLSYQFDTDNISASGLLLTTDRISRVPFSVNTILEMTIDPHHEWLDAPLACLGKVVRREICKETDKVPMTKTTKIGVQIVQIDNTDQLAWEKCVNKLLERQARQRTAPPIPGLAS